VLETTWQWEQGWAVVVADWTWEDEEESGRNDVERRSDTLLPEAGWVICPKTTRVWYNKVGEEDVDGRSGSKSKSSG